MFRSHRWLSFAALIFCSRIAAQPPLSTIQDILYRADGSPFNGVVTITWKTFEASDSSDIASDVKRITITAGNLYVQLVPSTTASPAAHTPYSTAAPAERRSRKRGPSRRAMCHCAYVMSGLHPERSVRPGPHRLPQCN